MHDDEFLDTIEEQIDFLNGINESNYWRSKLPSTADFEVGKICDLFVEATTTQRDVLVASLTQKECAILGSFEVRMAMLTVRERNPSLLVKGMVALVMELEWPETDLREVLMTLSVMYNSATKLGDPDGLFEAASQYAISQSATDTILGFTTRTPELKRIEVMGWQELEGPSGLIYQFGNQPIPDGFL